MLSTLKIRGDIFLLLFVLKILCHSLLDFHDFFNQTSGRNQCQDSHASFLFPSATDWLAEDHSTEESHVDVPPFPKTFSLTNFSTLPIHFCYSKEMHCVLPPLVHAILHKQTSQEIKNCRIIEWVPFKMGHDSMKCWCIVLLCSTKQCSQKSRILHCK